MAEKKVNIQNIDPVWGRIQSEASELILAEPLMGGMVHSAFFTIVHLEKH